MADSSTGKAAHYEKRGEVAVILLDSPPVNALGHALRRAIAEGLETALGDGEVKAIVIAGAGKVFCGGADITEFGKPIEKPRLQELNALCESSQKPVVAAIAGFAFGGGLELPLACHARVAAPGARLGLPEVKLGILPGAGGTQRLPRIVGVRAALDMIVTGTPIDARRARELGVVDAIIEGDLIEGAVAHARALLASGRKPVAVRDRDDRLAADRADRAAVEAHAEALLKKSRGLEAPRICARAVMLTLDTPFEEGLRKEGEFFLHLVAGTESKAQRHIFFAEREAARVPGVGKDTPKRRIASVGVIGAGTMGGGIAMAFANAGFPVTVLEATQDALERGLGIMQRNYETSVARGSIGREEAEARFGRLKGTTDYGDLADADLIVEAVFEEMAVKKEVFARLETVAKAGAILASNTSYLDVDAIAASTSRPQDIVGLHFFSPANVMKLLEIVRGRRTAPDVLATALSVGKAIGKVPVVVGVCHGFVGNRMLAARSAELENLLLEGALPAEVDQAFLDFGFPMGPFQMGDLAGLDISWRNRKSLGQTAAIADPLCEAGRFGQKTGRGWYAYPEGARQGVVDPAVTALIEEKARERGIARRAVTAQEIIERTLYPMVNEGARILEEGIAARASDIDIVWVYGYGFPVGKGGPMFWADHEGIGKIAARLRHWHERTGLDIYAPAGPFARPDDEGASFAALDAKEGKAA